jgi:predicted TIM-barrel fold metal-dependent hydrolase
LPDIEGALLELDFCFEVLEADGVVLLANNGGALLGDPALDPVFEELQRRHTVVFVHPFALPGLDAVAGIAPFIADFLLDTTRAAVDLACGGKLERCPDVRFMLAHAGGFLPYATYRLALAASPEGDYLHGLGLLGTFYFDVALSRTPSAYPSLLAFAQPGHITFGSNCRTRLTTSWRG